MNTIMCFFSFFVHRNVKTRVEWKKHLGSNKGPVLCLFFGRHLSPCENRSDNSILRVCVRVRSKMMDVCGEAESRLAAELMQHEYQIERDILDPLNQLAEVTHCSSLHTVVMTDDLHARI